MKLPMPRLAPIPARGAWPRGATAPGNRGERAAGSPPSRAVSGGRRRAFTLLELLAVIAIMGILAAISLPAIRGLKPNAKVAATRQLLDAVSRARQLAISQRTTVYMVFLSTNFFNGLSGANLDRVRPLLDKQMIGYAYVSPRSVGDQPGAHTPRYLSSWKTLPQGAFIPLGKFDRGLTLTNTSLLPAGASLFVPGFAYTNSLPFPSEADPVTVPVWLPYIAFDATGSLVRESGKEGQPELIPLSEGNILFARDRDSKAAQPLPPQANEQPPGNTLENYSMIYIEPLTGRARVESRKVQ
ncbi:MAG TPA: type II secretion system protein [Verrucomicrobiota bacterium]|nr:type II secretion system protein [Verrucomicrobiota bacterium]HRR65364.1 type II secretion system protein [Candidatus Paceibacterota bacterium]